jgi:TRAP-type C4-dicarboxylate transport system substrate-binding protein
MPSVTRLVLPAFALVAALPVFLGAQAGARPAAPPAPSTVINLATQAPTGTMWDLELKNLGAAWTKATAGRVVLKVFGNGSQGEEPSTITKMRIPTGAPLQAALLTAGGLSHLDKAFNVFTIPFFFETDEEEMAVQKKLEPHLEQALQNKGFHLLCWGTGGWIQVFSKKPLKNLDDVKKANLYVSRDDTEMTNWYLKNGFHPKPLTLADLTLQLKLANGAIDTAPNTPYLALMTQIFNTAKYMLDVHIAPLVGATIVSNNTWNQIPAEDRAKLTEAARAMETTIRTKAPGNDDTSITGMKAKGLQVITPDAKAIAEFRSAATEMGASMKGTLVPEDVYQMAVAARDEVRKAKGK